MSISFKSTEVRAADVLTNSYVAGTILTGCEKFNTLTLNVDFTIGSLTDAQIKVELSTNGTDYYQLLSDSIASGVNTPAVLVYKFAGTLVGSTTPLSLNTKYIKISSIGTGTVTGSDLSVEAVLSTN